MKPNQSLRYRQVEEGGIFNHFQFYLFGLSVTILFLFGVVACVANAERIDAWFSEVLKNIFL